MLVVGLFYYENQKKMLKKVLHLNSINNEILHIMSQKFLACCAWLIRVSVHSGIPVCWVLCIVYATVSDLPNLRSNLLHKICWCMHLSCKCLAWVSNSFEISLMTFQIFDMIAQEPTVAPTPRKGILCNVFMQFGKRRINYLCVICRYKAFIHTMFFKTPCALPRTLGAWHWLIYLDCFVQLRVLLANIMSNFTSQ